MNHPILAEIDNQDLALKGVHIEEVQLDEPFLQTASRFAGNPGTVVLMSGGNLDCARFHILAAKPWLSLAGHGRLMKLRINNLPMDFHADPFGTLKIISRHFRQDLPEVPVPVAAGLFGYLAYDLKDHLEQLPRTSVDDLKLPQICFFAPAMVMVHDRKKKRTFLCLSRRTAGGKDTLEADRNQFYETLSADLPKDKGFGGDPGGFRSNFTQEAYEAAVGKIKDYIAAGHVYQVNMSQRFHMDFQGDGFSLFKSLYLSNPAPFFAYIRADDHQVVSTSPERFVRQTGTRVETRPIKGTRPRGKTKEADDRLGRELLQSKKDDAELSMIVDLLRNDIGKVCRGGTVRVREHKRLEAYENVFHLVSIVTGELSEDKDAVDLIAAAFPGGSITGCPKIRSMEIIDELEPCRRHIYTGSIGYIGFHDTMDLSIAIRTATIQNNKIIFSVGGGIVYDSDPHDEYEETLHKGRTLMDVFKGNIPMPGTTPMAWINGALAPMDEVVLPITDKGVQYGYGFFETIRVHLGRAGFLTRHMERFNEAWQALFGYDIPDLTWKSVIDQVIHANHLEHQTAAVKVIATGGDRDTPPLNPNLIVMARPYTHRLNGEKKAGLHLATYPEPRQTPLANYKTLNYLYYYLAAIWAKNAGADEALILNPDGTVSETNTANIIIIKDNKVLSPRSPAVLPGVMEKAVISLLAGKGYGIERKKVFPKDLLAADTVMVTNSLMGAVPVLTLDETPLCRPTGLCQEINDELL